MTTPERIADQLNRAYAGEAWHGPSLRELLQGISAKAASSRPVAQAHNIWELVLHITAWESAALRRLHGEPAKLSPQEDWPAAAEAGEESWRQTLASLDETNARLRDAIAALPEPALQGEVFILLHGVIQHNAYHAGQIALLKKAS